jgi:hypothetical protein
MHLTRIRVFVAFAYLFHEGDAPMRYLSLAVVVALAATTVASAQPGGSPEAGEISPALRQACEGDYQRFCAGVQPGGGRILQCLRTHTKNLSESCRTTLLEHKP